MAQSDIVSQEVKVSHANSTGKTKAFFRKHGIAYVFLTPAVIFLVTLLLLPFFSIFYMSFRSVNLLRPELQQFVGLDNFVKVISDPLFWSSLWHGLVWTFGSVTGEYIIGLITAILLHQDIKGRAIFRGIMIVPWVVPIVVAAMTWRWILNPDFGILNLMLMKAGLLKTSINWLGGTSTAMLTDIFVNIWRSFPMYTVMLLAALQAIPKEIMEAAQIDGANAWQRFCYVTMPNLKIVSVILILLHVIWTFNNFDFIWLLTEAGPLHATETFATNTYRLAFKQFHFDQASALAVIMILILVLLMGIYFWADSKKKAADTAA